jgi:hypothetical protein
MNPSNDNNYGSEGVEYFHANKYEDCAIILLVLLHFDVSTLFFNIKQFTKQRSLLKPPSPKNEQTNDFHG